MKKITSPLLPLLAALLLMPAGIAFGQLNEPKLQTTNEAIQDICKKLAERLTALDQSAVQVVPVADGREVPGGPGIYDTFVDIMEAHKIKDVVRAPYKVVLNMSTHIDAPHYLVITVTLKDKRGKEELFTRTADNGAKETQPVKYIEETVAEVGSVARARGLNVDIPTEIEEKYRLAELEAQVGRKFHYDAVDGWVKLKRNGKFAIRIVDQNGKPYKVIERDGHPVLLIPKGAEYRIGLQNNADFEAAAHITVDGLSVFQFGEASFHNKQTGLPTLSNYVVQSHKEATIFGWFINQQKNKAFEVTDFSNSAAHSLKHPREKIGVITVSFSACWLVGANPPADEGDKQSSKAGTKQGRDLDVNTKIVKRNIGKVRTVISLKYDLAD